MTSSSFLGLVLAGALAACGSGRDQALQLTGVDTLQGAQAPAASPTTYEYGRVTTNPDSVLRALNRGGVALVEAWYPLDNLCMDPLGARLTVRIARPDPIMARFDFILGNGRLGCATGIRHYRFQR